MAFHLASESTLPPPFPSAPKPHLARRSLREPVAGWIEAAEEEEPEGVPDPPTRWRPLRAGTTEEEAGQKPPESSQADLADGPFRAATNPRESPLVAWGQLKQEESENSTTA
ncbi:hypothetical protein [Novipirellula artificiosorum]|uniref:hypothetical protein n=1 Tax=Novipirellula artificiosorum TaxID=2528016 RepID=UPI001E4D27CF|nr:hypothetical protein [Novipirellula artificiosorum]